jgi:hypothetical protein
MGTSSRTLALITSALCAWAGPAGLLGAAALLSPGVALAGDPDRAAVLEAEGKAAYRDGDYMLAVQKFTEAFTANPDPAIRANQGLAYEALGQNARALEAFQAFLDSNPPPEKATKAKERVAALAPEVKIISDPPGARIYIDDQPKPLGETPATLKLVADRHDIVLRKSGYKLEKLVVRVRIGTPTEASARLRPDTNAASTQRPIDADTPVQVRQVTPMGGGGVPTASWVAFGVGAAAVAGVVVFQVWGRGAADERDGAQTASAWEAWDDRVGLHNTGFLVSTGVAVAAVGTGVTLWLLNRRGTSAAVPVTPVVSPTAAPGGGGVQLHWRF